VVGFKGQEGFADLQKRAWEHVKRALDEGLPCYGWELEAPEFYVIYGYDDVGYYYSGAGCDEGRGPKPWQELGDTGIGVVELYSVRPGQAADDAMTVRQALAFALEHATSPEKWVFADYRAGLEGYDNWIRALEVGKAGDFGMRYNAAVWAECRQFALAFLQEAQERIGGRVGPLFDGAIDRYRAVAENLTQVAEAYPFSEEATMDVVPLDERCRAAIKALKAAREAEAGGLRALEGIVEGL
jgi:hypothetical protein